MKIDDTRRDLVLTISPCGSAEPSPRVAAATRAAGGLGIVDLGAGGPSSLRALEQLGPAGPIGIRVPGNCTAAVEAVRLASRGTVRVVVLTHDSPWALREIVQDYRVLVEVANLTEARLAAAGGADGLVLRGLEGGGRVSELTSFVLLQQVLADDAIDLPVWVAGGIGPRTAAACVIGGAAGVVLDSQLALMPEADLPDTVRAAIRRMDGSEVVTVGDVRGLMPEVAHRHRRGPGLAAQAPDPAMLLPVGQDGWLAASFASRWRNTAAAVRAIRQAILDTVGDDLAAPLLAPGSPLASAWNVQIPVAQGPMTRVSDQIPFVAAVAAAGALPFVALALSDTDQTRLLLTEAARTVAGRPWGVGILGFVPQSMRAAQLEVVREAKPTHAIVAGGSPAQARILEDAGVAAFLHVPSPGLLGQFLRAGSRRFVFEGLECGGHVGPRTSFSLWEAQLGVIEEFLDGQAPGTAGELEVLFAGGIHDARSAAMAAAMAAPLARRGGRVGVLMGTAYLFTDEAVACGAIKPAFQRYALGAGQTSLLTTAPGHAIRCLDTPFVAEFDHTRAELEAQGLDNREVWEQLELLNLGRLRIASKGIIRDGDSLVAVDEAVQQTQGLFMAGQVAILRDRTTTLAALHDEVTSGSAAFCSARQARLRPHLGPGGAPRTPDPQPADIAIIGMSCIFPGSPDLGSYWRTIVDGLDQVTEVPTERWDTTIFYAPEAGIDRSRFSVSRWGGFLAPTPFDAIGYGIPPAALASIDPQQVLALETASRALADAGYEPGAPPVDHSRTGVVFAAQAGGDMGNAITLRATYRTYVGELPAELDEQLPAITEDTFPGLLANVTAGRIANRLDLGGPNFTVDAACASSLAAVRVGCQELITGSSDLMLCGAVDLHSGINDYIMFTSSYALSPSGRCRTFDDGADGTTLGEGVACVVLKRLADAERDGDRVYAVLKSIGSSSDGRALGLTAPRPEGQVQALTRAYQAAGLSPGEVGLIEAHGTGTVTGDRTEIESLTSVFHTAGAQPGSCTLGSVKSQIGHAKSAAGLAGLIKAVLAISSGVLPPTLNITQPNAAWDPATSPFAFAVAARPWTAPAARRVAGVSAFGFGGTNFHAVLTGHDGAAEPRHARDQWPAELFCFRGPDRQAAHNAAKRLADRLAEARTPEPLNDLAAAVSEEQAAASGPVQLAIVARDTGELAILARRALAGEHDPADGLVQALVTPLADPSAAEPGRVAFLYPGQGSQHPNGLRDLFVTFPQMRRFLGTDARWADLMFPPTAFDEAGRRDQRRRLRTTTVAQPVLGISGLALSDLLGRLGIRPDMVGGHSYGELAALCCSGVFDQAQLLELSSARGESILAAIDGDPGAMAAVAGTAQAVNTVLSEAGLAGDVIVANHNAPAQVVVSGTSPAMTAAATALRSAGLSVIPLDVQCAFHSPVVATARDHFARVLADRPLAAPNIPVWSNRTAAPYPADPELIRHELTEQIAAPVLFADQIRSMYDHGARVFIEVGPGDVLSKLVRDVLGDRPHLAVAFETGESRGLRAFLLGVAQLAGAGVPVEPGWLFRGREAAARAVAGPKPGQIWTVDGVAVRDGEGCRLPGGMTQARRITVPPAAHPPHASAPGAGAEAILHEFIRTSRDMLTSQRDVLLSYFGRPGPDMTWREDDSRQLGAAVTAVGPARPGGTASDTAVPVARLTDASGRAAQNGIAPPSDLATTLLAVIAELTGYPIDLIEQDMDLEAELSITSIKRAEIGVAVTQRLGLEPAGDLDLQEVFRARTVRTIVEQLSQLGGGSVAATPTTGMADTVALPEPAEPPEPAKPLDQELTPTRLLPTLTVRPAIPCEMTAAAGARILVTGDQDISRPVCGYLRGLGATPVAGSLGEADLADVDGLLILDGLGGPGDSVVTRALPAIQQAVNAKVRWLLAARRYPAGPLTAGLAGLLRTVEIEHPSLTARLLEVTGDVAGDQFARLLANELDATSRDPVVVYRGSERFVTTLVPAELGWPENPGGPGNGQAEAAKLGLRGDSVVVLFGGARGITAHTALAFAAASRCRLELVGRTPLAGDPRDEEVTAVRDMAGLRSALAARGMRSPAQVERAAREIMARREVHTTIEELQAAGSEVRYHQVDVTDPAATARLIKEIHAVHGSIDGVIHGAGVIEDRLLADKDAGSFARVFGTKADGAKAILSGLDAISAAPVFTVFFGSVAAAYGNRGQADYAAANEAMETMGAEWAKRTRHRCLTIHWGPWAPKGNHSGMVTPELQSEFRRRGVGLINPDAGALSLLRELAWGDPALTAVVYAASA